MMTNNIFDQEHKEYIISDYKKDFTLFSQHKGTSHSVKTKLQHFIYKLRPFISEVKNKDEVITIGLEFSIIETEVLNYLKETFPKAVIEKYSTLPPKRGFDYREMARDFKLLNLDRKSSEKITYFEKKKKLLIHKFEFLEYLLQNLKDCGLHKDIWKRDRYLYAKYHVMVEHNFGIKRKKKEFSEQLSEKNMEADYLQPYLSQEMIFLNGKKIPYSNIITIKISYSIFRDNELQSFRKKHKIHSDLDFFNALHDITNELLSTSKVNKSLSLSDNIWDLIHPIFQKLAKPHIKSGQYADAVLVVFKELNDIVKQEFKTTTGEEEDGVSLMRKAFKYNDPVFKLISDVTSQNGKSFQDGYMQLFAGSMAGIRNPKAHKNLKIGLNDAIEKLILASHLLKVFENRQP